MKRGFTLLEILLVVAIISILAGIVIVAINPAHQLAMARDAQRRSDIKAVYNAVQQYLLDHNSYPVSAPDLTTICRTESASAGVTCTDLVNLSSVVPTYLTAIPHDPSSTSTTEGSGYRIIASAPYLYVDAPLTEVASTTISIGKAPEGSTPAPAGPVAGGFGSSDEWNGTYTLAGTWAGSNYYEKDSTHVLYGNPGPQFWFLGSYAGDPDPAYYAHTFDPADSFDPTKGTWIVSNGTSPAGNFSGTYP